MDYLGDLIGEILDDEIGARAGRARRQARRAGRRANRAARRAGRAAASSTPRTVGNKLLAGDQRADILGLGSVTVPAGSGGSSGLATLQTVVQKPIQISRLILSGEPGWEAVNIMDIKIGVDSQFTSTDGAPAAMFGPTAVGAGVQFRPAQTGVTVTITLANPTANAVTISGSALGISAQ